MEALLLTLAGAAVVRVSLALAYIVNVYSHGFIVHSALVDFSVSMVLGSHYTSRILFASCTRDCT